MEPEHIPNLFYILTINDVILINALQFHFPCERKWQICIHIIIIMWFRKWYFDGFVQEKCNSNASAMELHFSCTNPSIWYAHYRPSDNYEYTKHSLATTLLNQWFMCHFYKLHKFSVDMMHKTKSQFKLIRNVYNIQYAEKQHNQSFW